jgi:hypothetical protein
MGRRFGNPNYSRRYPVFKLIKIIGTAMYKVFNRTDKLVYIFSHNDFRIFSISAFRRAKTQKNRPVKIRKPVQVVINGELFIFIKKQWDKGRSLALDYLRFCKGLPSLYRWERKTRHNILKKQAKIRNQRIINDAYVIARSKSFERY